MSNPNDKLYDAKVRHSLNLEQVENALAKEFVGVLSKHDKELLRTFFDGLARSYDASLTAREFELALRSLEVELKGINTVAYDELLEHAVGQFTELLEHEVEFQVATLQSAVQGASITTAGLMLGAIVNNHNVRDKTVKQWVQGMGQARTRALVAVIREGKTDGLTIDEIQRNVLGTKSAGYKDGLIGKFNNSVNTFVATAVTALVVRTNEDVAIANKHLFKGVQWVSVLDSRTSPICRARDGKVYPLGEGARPPAHYRCRSVVMEILKGHPLPSDKTYYEWLKEQSQDTVYDILGKTRGDLYFKGKLPAEAMHKRSGELLTLDELKRRERQAFDKADL